MQALDRLGWAAEVSFEVFGLSIGVRTNEPSFLPTVSPYLPAALKAYSAPSVQKLYSIIAGDPKGDARIRHLHLLYGNVERLARTAEISDLLNVLRSNVNLYVAENAPQRVFVHAGAVGWKGRAIVIPGASFSGKTTLVQEFLRAGATYYSDELAVLDAQGRVYPYGGTLSVRNANSGKQEMRRSEEFGGAMGKGPLPVGCVIATHYRPGVEWNPQAISKGLGVMALLGNTVAARKNPSQALAALSRAVADARILKGRRGEAREVVDFILEDLDKRPPSRRN
jgi:hypothetical protein